MALILVTPALCFNKRWRLAKICANQGEISAAIELAVIHRSDG